VTGLDTELDAGLEALRAAERPRPAQGRIARRRDGPRAVDGRDCIAFCSNDYLGLAQDPRVVEAFVNAARHWGVGSGASHLVSGHTVEHHALERELAEFVGRPRALLFSTGYMANLAVAGALLGRGDRVLEDRLNHASLIDGVSRAAHGSGVTRTATSMRCADGSGTRIVDARSSRATACSAWTAMPRRCRRSRLRAVTRVRC
jgi:8-amino-7-oxononanoate synthase